MTDTDGFLAAHNKSRPSTNKQARSVYYNSMKRKEFQVPDGSSSMKKGPHHHNSFSTNKTRAKKKKINKLLCEIVGEENKGRLELRTGSATRFFDEESDK